MKLRLKKSHSTPRNKTPGESAAAGGGREPIAAAGATALDLPPHSLDSNPMEKAGSKIQQHLRKSKARTLNRLEHAVAPALASVTSQAARGWFRHCGYAIHEL